MVNNIFGGELAEGRTWLSVPTLGNARKLNASYGASEVRAVAIRTRRALVTAAACRW